MSNKEMPVPAATEQAAKEKGVSTSTSEAYYSTDPAQMQEGNSIPFPSASGRRTRRNRIAWRPDTPDNAAAPTSETADNPSDEDAAKKRALKERPPFVRVSKRKDLETGALVEVESVSCPRLAQYVREHSHFKFVKYPNAKTPVRFWYKNGVYVEVYEDEIMGEINKLIDAWNPDIARQRDVEEVYKTIKRNPGDGRFVDFAAKDAEELVVNFKNGLFYPMTWELKPHTPELFTTRQLPFDFPKEALDRCFMCNDKIPTFNRFMRRFCYGANYDHPDGANRWTCLCEWMTLILSNVNSSHVKKSVWMHGKGDSGKSQLLELMHYMLGDFAHSTDLEQLEARFGCGGVFNKRLVYAPDQKFIKVKELGVFKRLVGAGDGVNLERKGRDGFTYNYDGFLWLCMNELPKFGGDHGEHVYKRMIIFKTPDSIPEAQQDGTILAKMKAEAPYIAAYLLRLLPNVVERGYKLTEPAESAKARSMYAFENEPVRQWLAECCIDTENPGEQAAEVEAWRRSRTKQGMSTMYAVYCEWCRQYENGYKLKRNEWKRELKAIAGDPDMSDEIFFLNASHHGGGKVIARWCLNAEALKAYSDWLDKD